MLGIIFLIIFFSQIHYHGQQKSIMVEKGKLKEIMIFVVSCEKMRSGSKSIINLMYLHYILQITKNNLQKKIGQKVHSNLLKLKLIR